MSRRYAGLRPRESADERRIGVAVGKGLVWQVFAEQAVVMTPTWCRSIDLSRRLR